MANNLTTKQVTARTVLAQKGSSTLELLIAFVIITLALTAVILVVFGNQSMTIDAELGQQALNKAGQRLEEARAKAKENFIALNTIPSFPPLPLPLGELYSTTTVVTDITPCIKKVDSLVDYRAEARVQQTKFSTLITSLEEFFDSGGNCDTDPNIEDWDNPDKFAGFDSPNIEATAIDVIKKDGNIIVFLGSKKPGGGGGGGGADPDDFWILDATSALNPVPGNPTPLGSYNIDKEQVEDIYATQDGYAYIAQASTTAQFLVMDIRNLVAPKLIKAINLPGYSGTCTPNCPHGLSVYFYQNKIYVGAHFTGFGGGNEFHIFQTDGAGTPDNPQPVDSLDINHNVNDIVISGDFAYLATSDDNGELMIININPASPDYLKLPDDFSPPRKFDAPGGADGTKLYLAGTTVYLGRERSPSDPDLYVIDVNNPDLISQPQASLDAENLSLANNTGITGIAVRGRLAFVVSSDPTDPFQVWDISNPRDIRPRSICSVTNFSEKASDLDFVENLGFVSNESSKALRIIHDKPTTCS